MTVAAGGPPAQPARLKDLSPAAQAAAEWLRLLARTLRTCQLYKATNPLVVQSRAQVWQRLTDLLATHGALTLTVTAGEVRLNDETVVGSGPRAAGSETVAGPEERLPFLFYRDGIRGLTLLPGIPQRDVEALLDAMAFAMGGPTVQEDLVTQLWQANPAHLALEVAPLEQIIYLSAEPEEGSASGGGQQPGQSLAWSPTGTAVRADLGRAAGDQALQRDTFDDWELPEECAEVPEAWMWMRTEMDRGRARFATAWAEERARDWTDDVSNVCHELLLLDPSDDMRRTLARSLATWVATALRYAAWEEGQRALATLNEIDPGCAIAGAELAAAASGVDSADITERLDQAEPEEQARFFALMVAMGRAALDIACAVLARSENGRTRAAACTALCYLCGDEPGLLAPYLTDSRWTMVRNVVFVLGQIGGPQVAPLLQLAANHPEPRVRRQVMQAVGSIPRSDQLTILLGQIETRDALLLPAILQMLAREKNPQVGRALLDIIEAPDFESRSEENQRALFSALGEVADDEAVPALEALLHKGGWFARRTLARVAAARTLRRIGTPAAMDALEAGLHARSEAVRGACYEVLGARSAP